MWRNGVLARHDDTRTHDAGMHSFVQRAQRATERCREHPDISDRDRYYVELARCKTYLNRQLDSAKRAHRSDPKSNMHRSARV